MSKYTTQLRYICEVEAGYKESQPYSKVNEIVKAAAPKIFNAEDWPIFDENYRLALEIKILKAYYTEEISMETVGLWKLRLNQKLSEIMPYYNQMYKSELLEFNPLYDVDLTRTKIGKGTKQTQTDSQGVTSSTSDSSTTSESSNTNTESEVNKYSDTPQGGLTGLENGRYLTDARMVSNNGSGNATGSGTSKATGSSQNVNTSNENAESTDEYLEHVSGVNGGASIAERLKEYRSTFVNIDLRIIEELEDLFMKVW